ncbi:MAG TPA: DUF6644 family protein [Bryobacteraceae bacterium]|nr:DUF6644 family protein [Bryobacteraceae bacterium]
MLFPLFVWLQRTYLAETIRHSAFLIATLEIVHLVGMTLLLGTILMIDLSVLGRGIAGYPAARIARELRRWTLAGLALMLASGPLILISEAERCYHTPAFWIKMALLAAALAFYFTIHQRTVVEAAETRGGAKFAAVISLALWTGVALAGKAIAIFQPA